MLQNGGKGKPNTNKNNRKKSKKHKKGHQQGDDDVTDVKEMTSPDLGKSSKESESLSQNGTENASSQLAKPLIEKGIGIIFLLPVYLFS